MFNVITTPSAMEGVFVFAALKPEKQQQTSARNGYYDVDIIYLQLQ
jgi:hypothetical protein